MYEWDENNLRKLAVHRVTPEEAIEALEDDAALDLAIQYHRRGEIRYPVLGATKKGRLLIIIWVDKSGRTRIINAFDAAPVLRRLYRN